MFSSCRLGPLTLKNRITMAPLFLGYGKPSGEVSPLLLDHYREMAASGAAMIVVENAAVDPGGLGSPFTLRLDQDQFLPGLWELASTIKGQGAVAAIQINHAGRFAWSTEPVAPSPVAAAGKVAPRALTRDKIRELIRKFAAAALRAKQAGFELVELHGGTGYLLAQFLSPRTNRREDAYGGSLENRLHFPLEVIRAVREALGPDFPVGYRFLADEWLPDGLQLVEAKEIARRLAEAGLAYLSVMGGTYESFFLPERKEQERNQGYMADLAAAVKSGITIPVIAAGRLQEPAFAEGLIFDGKADLIGLARVLLADPQWPIKAEQGRAAAIVPCEPTCSLCFKRVMQGQPVVCSQWPKEKRERVGEV
ncbi:MAG: NADH:flavin oxidoreductase [Deltaproteobacteria bacterium]|nr:NADH:flavin oxidoreductase [Deltaproteobacteria bacterium]